MILQALAFWVFATVTVASGAMVVISRNPVYSVLFLILAFFNAAALFVLPVAVHGFSEWSPSTARPPSPLTPGLVEALRERVPPGAVVFSDPETSYRIASSAPVLIAAAPPGHVADTVENRPYERRADASAFFAGGDLAIPRRYRAGWLVLDRSRFVLALGRGVERSYADERYTLYRLLGAG